jgi:hypothetical protein
MTTPASPTMHDDRMAGASSYMALLVCLVVVGGPLGAQPPPPAAPGAGVGGRVAVTAADTGRLASAVNERYAVPDIPAVTFLNVSPSNISRPTTPKDFVVELADAVDEQGRVRHGFAIEVSPVAALPGFHVSLRQYREDKLQYALANLLVSIATVQNSGDTSSTNIAYGLRTTLIDRGDPMLDEDFLRSFGDAMVACAPETPLPPALVPFPGQPDTMQVTRARYFAERAEEQRTCLANRPAELAREYVAQHWNQTRLVAAFVYGELLPGARLSDRVATGSRAWLVGGMPLGKSVQGVGYVDYSHTRALDTVPSFDAWTYGARINAGGPRINFFYERLGRAHSDPPEGFRKRTTAWSGGIEFMAANNVWISTGLGERFQETVQPDRVVVIANIKWGIATKPWLTPN